MILVTRPEPTVRPPSRIAKLKAFLHCDRVNELTGDRNVVARHNHLGALGEVCNTGNVGGAEVELRTIAIEERGVTAALFLGQDVDLALELGVRSNATGLAENLATDDVLALNATEQAADVVASLSLVEELTEHLDAGADGVLGLADADDLQRVVDMQNATLNTTGSNGATAGDGHGVLNSHQEGLVGHHARGSGCRSQQRP